ncbi:MAG TPA: hypothetical protein VNO79_01845 [Actinomycetota bacterium]|nr:hypothetical protein [Actinomycetota bacterium]
MSGRPARRRLALALLVASVVTPAPGPAAAKGEPFSFHARWYEPGEVAVGRLRFDARSNEAPDRRHAPFYAYLIPMDRREWWIDPPRVPREAIRVGTVRFRPARDRDTRFDRVAVVRFTVPDLPSGFYALDYCNDPCRDSMVGIARGRTVIARTPTEAALLFRTRRLEWRLEAAERQIRQGGRRLEVLRSRSEALAASAAERAEAIQALRRETSALRRRLDEAERDRGAPWLPWLLLPLAFGAGAALGRTLDRAAGRRVTGRTFGPPGRRRRSPGFGRNVARATRSSSASGRA